MFGGGGGGGPSPSGLDLNLPGRPGQSMDLIPPIILDKIQQNNLKQKLNEPLPPTPSDIPESCS